MDSCHVKCSSALILLGINAVLCTCFGLKPRSSLVLQVIASAYVEMATTRSLRSYLALVYVASTYASIGPVADLTISNANVAPDGFTRAAIVTNGVFPGPLITGNMVWDAYTIFEFELRLTSNAIG